MEWGLLRLASILAEYDYQCLNLLSCMTLDNEKCHATVHAKKVKISKLEYARTFGATMKESVKRAAQWAAYCPYYHESKVLVPKYNRFPSKCTIDGTPVYQRSVLLQMTVSFFATLCELLRLFLNFGLDEGEDLHDVDPNEDAIDSNNPDEGQDEFDESSDEDVDVSADDNTSQGSTRTAR
ncbi:Hypothetical predicted protein [Paramuricea clavata]|uniref:Uncharacterized protein n=1 Tax=Paramuricea clavata TaxID=317549 RepID=A0A6S7FYY9_PARCT|nr:Hypothetical predicted protein [Paramuricea clavata]